MRTTSSHEYDAWIQGVHDMPEGWLVASGYVLVHDLVWDEWSAMTEEDFNQEYDWVIVEETI